MSAPIPAQFGFSLSMIIQWYAKGSLRGSRVVPSRAAFTSNDD
jgi:hypothetical protein